jgi:hypothetical protein
MLFGTELLAARPEGAAGTVARGVTAAGLTTVATAGLITGAAAIAGPVENIRDAAASIIAARFTLLLLNEIIVSYLYL